MKNRKYQKYKNHKIDNEYGKFDSTKEFYRFLELKEQEERGEIKNLHRQVEFELIPVQREPDTIGARGGIKQGKVIEHKCSYIADFTYQRNGELVVEDTKGFRTSDYIIKRKLMLYLKEIKIQEL